MPASACCLAMNCLAMSCLATGAEALRRLCGGVPIGGRPMLGQGRSCSGEPLCSSDPLTLGSTACITEGPLMPDSVRRPPLSGRVARGLFSGASHPMSGYLQMGGYLQPRRLEEREVRAGPAGRRLSRAPGSLPPPGLDGGSCRRSLRRVLCCAFCFCTSSAFALRRTGRVFTGAASLLFDWSRRPDRRDSCL
jgi:hypothetical protein